MSTICKTMDNNSVFLDNLPLRSGGEGKDLLSEDNRQVHNPLKRKEMNTTESITTFSHLPSIGPAAVECTIQLSKK